MKVELKNINKSFGPNFSIKDYNLTIESGSFTTLLGPSGCGKTTILRMIAGLVKPDSGEILFDNKKIYSSNENIFIPPEKRNLGFVFQDFALWPHMNVFENIAFPLRVKKQSKKIVMEKVLHALEAVKLIGLENRYIHQLSGGQQQRVAFARAIVANPNCILFDEPLSALDAVLREQMRIEIKKITREFGTTSIFVTHDQMEAMSISDTIVVMNNGSIEQSDIPETIYQNPSSKFVANFIGKSNWIEDNKMIRPENVYINKSGTYLQYEGSIIEQQYIGNVYEVYLNVGGNQWIVRTKNKQKVNNIKVYVDHNDIIYFNE